MRQFSYYLMVLHTFYIGCLGFLALLALKFSNANVNPAAGIGWLPAVLYTMIVIQMYRIPKNAFRALLAVTLVPLQVGMHVYIFDGDVWLYFLEVVAIEYSALWFAVAIAVSIDEIDLLQVGLAMCFVALSYFSFGKPLLKIYSHYEWYWSILLLFSLLSSIWATVQVLAAGYASSQGTTGKKIAQHDKKWKIILLGDPNETIALELSDRILQVFTGILFAIWITLAIVLNNMRT